ncbi:helix-turn-helix domain-containing protein [Vagococcus fluvialis]|uniref:AraC family transcriptional regulator n=1 Tax=Vagococcus fluvialis TaxID=2738 RepID=UPI003D0A824E
MSKSSDLGNIKNYIISAKSLILNPNVVFKISDLSIQKLEKLDNSSYIQQLSIDVFINFINRVEKLKNFKYSKPINDYQNNIFSHFQNIISINDLAKLVNLHPNYLSALLKKEVALTIVDYIHLLKINESKTLITYSNYSLIEISRLLNF